MTDFQDVQEIDASKKKNDKWKKKVKVHLKNRSVLGKVSTCVKDFDDYEAKYVIVMLHVFLKMKVVRRGL